MITSSIQQRKGNFVKRDIVVDHGSASSSGNLVQQPEHGESLVSTTSSHLSTAARSPPRRRQKRKRIHLLRSQGHCIVSFFLCLGVFTFALCSLQLVPSAWYDHHPAPVRLPVAGVDIAVPNVTEWPFIHIVNTRFMQEQGPLKTLGMARLHLFWTFCFPTMIGQSTQNFFWIIKTDPQFAVSDNPVFDQLLETVMPYSNIYVVASNNNFFISPDRKGCWRDGAEGQDLLASTIFTGNITKVHQAIALREHRPILETRLDADDGLHFLYLQYLQYAALKRFYLPPTTKNQQRQSSIDETDDRDDGTSRASIDKDKSDDDDKDQGTRASKITTPQPVRWSYWCTRRHFEWRPSDSHQNVHDESFGVLNPIEHSSLCITPGITVGFNVGVDAKEVPSESHDLLYKHLANSTNCYGTASDGKYSLPLQDHKANNGRPACLDLVEDLPFSAIRSRTWTSAGMQDVETSRDGAWIPKNKVKEMNAKLWELLEKHFHMNRTQVHVTKEYLQAYKAQIAYENLLGQCTTFHSCKQQAKDALQKYIDEGKAESESEAKIDNNRQQHIPILYLQKSRDRLRGTS